MKNLVITLVLSLSFLKLFSATCTANADGNWGSKETWSCNRVPGDGDKIIINPGVTVNVNVVTPILSGVTIEVYGTLDFDNGMKINLAPDGVVNVYSGGSLTGGNDGSKIVIGGNTVFRGNTTRNGPFTLNFYGETALPVKLSSFKVNLTKDKKIELIWVTEVEVYNDYFAIEKSVNGVDYKKIGALRGNGNSNKRITYKFVDDSPTEGNTYYRLKQVDFDGKFEYFGPVTINYHNTPNEGCVLKVYPNPCQMTCKIAVEGCNDTEKQMIEMELIDANGNKIHSHIPIRQTNGNFDYEIDVKNYLKPGVYIVRGANKSENYSKRLIVK